LFADQYIQIQDSTDPPDEQGWFMQVNKTGGGINQFFMERIGAADGTPSEFIMQVYDDSNNARLLWFKKGGELELPDDLIIGREVANAEAGAVEFRSYEPQASVGDYGWHAFWSTASAPSGVDSRMVIQPARDIVSGVPVLYSGDLQISTSPDGVVQHRFVFTKDGTIEIDDVQVVPPP
jgi:hypothetical protein